MRDLLYSITDFFVVSCMMLIYTIVGLPAVLVMGGLQSMHKQV